MSETDKSPAPPPLQLAFPKDAVLIDLPAVEDISVPPMVCAGQSNPGLHCASTAVNH